MRPQATVSNPLRDNIICPSVHLSGPLQAFCGFMSVCLVVLGTFWTQINASRRWTPTLEINTNTFPVWVSSIAMYLYKSSDLVDLVKRFQHYVKFRPVFPTCCREYKINTYFVPWQFCPKLSLIWFDLVHWQMYFVDLGIGQRHIYINILMPVILNDWWRITSFESHIGKKETHMFYVASVITFSTFSELLCKSTLLVS